MRLNEQGPYNADGKRIAKEYKTELSMLAIFVVFFAALSFASPYFLTTKNIMNVMRFLPLH